MTTDHELEARLLAARGVPADPPALPEAFLDLVHASDVGLPDQAPAPGRSRRPTRTTVLRTSAAVLAVAAAWTTAVLVSGPGAAPPRGDAPQAGGVELVDFALPAFPFTLPTPPPGTAGPVFGGSGGGGASMSYASTEDPLESVSIRVSSEPAPPGGSVGFPGSVAEETTIGGAPAVIVAPAQAQEEAVASLDWERAPGQWVSVMATGRYAERDLLVGIAGSLVDRPQAMPVQLHLAPAGYSLDFFKDDGRVVRLADDADPERGLTVRLPFPGEPAPIDGPSDVVDGTAGPVEEVVVQGRPALLVRTDLGGGGAQGWFLQARLPAGGTFVVEAPGDLAREQVVQLADQVTYAP